MSVLIKLSRSSRIYRPHEVLQGKIITKLSSSISHSSIRLTVNGSANLQVRGGSAGVIESLVGVVKPYCIVSKSIEIRSSGKITSGTTEIPFSVVLKELGEDNLEKFYETFHGANISIQQEDTFINHFQRHWSSLLKVDQDTQRHPLLPELKSGGFKVTGKIPTQCSLTDPLSGDLTVEASSGSIESIDIHLIRVESILVGERTATETSVIQTTQIADGDVCRGRSLPIYVILPRLLTCPTVLAGPFSIEFKVYIVITFKSELSKLHPKPDPRTPRLWTASENFPLELVRTW
ncbi:hypothetical protein V2J09_019425 [Rumex salicifolius]